MTSGVVSRIEVTAYAHGATELLGVQIDAAINSGNRCGAGGGREQGGAGCRAAASAAGAAAGASCPPHPRTDLQPRLLPLSSFYLIFRCFLPLNFFLALHVFLPYDRCCAAAGLRST